MMNLENFILQKILPIYIRLTYVARERNPRKLNREKFGQGSSAKILVLENKIISI